jgi:hypothetical protein
MWRTRRLVTTDECVHDARAKSPLFGDWDEDEVVDRRHFSVPRGFEGELSVAVTRAGDLVVGKARVVESAIGRCYASGFETRARGDGAEQAVAIRLAVITDHVLAEVAVLDIERRVEPLESDGDFEGSYRSEDVNAR